MHDRTIRGYEIVRQVPDKQREVYLAHRGNDTRDVVLVVAELEGSDAARLELEARRCLELESVAFTNVVDYFVEDDRHFVAFEHVEGTSLHRLMRYVEEQDERLGDGAVLHIGVGLLAALNMAHSAKTDDGKAAPIIHGQLGPHQVLISWEGMVKVMGFGLSVMFEKAGPPPNWLMPYVAPEVRDGRPHTSRANVYAAGAMLWTLLARQPLPEDGSRPRPLRKVRPDLPPSVTFPLDRALEPEAGKRISAKALQVGLTRAIEDADREELRWAMEVCRVRCTVEEEFLPQESLPPNQSGVPVSSSRSPDSDVPTGVTDQKQLLDAARLIGPLPWEQGDEPTADQLEDKPEPPRRNAGRPRPATRRRVGRKSDEDSVVIPRPGPPRPQKLSGTDIIPTIPAPDNPHGGTGTLEAGVAPPVVEPAAESPASPGPSESAPISYPPMPSSAYPVPGGAVPPGYVHPSQYPPGVYAGQPSSFAPGSVYPYPASAAPHMMPGLGFPMVPSQAPPAMPKLWVAAVAMTAVASFLVGVIVSSGLELRFGDRAPAPTVTVTVPAPVPPPAPVTAAPTVQPPAPAPTAEPVAATPEPAETEQPDEPEETPAEDDPPEEVSTEPVIATTDASAALPAHKAHLLVHTEIKDAHVYVHGKLSGPVEERIEVDCGMKFVRLGRSPNTGWLEPGRAFEIPCRTFVTVTIEPRPSYNWPRGQFLK